MVVCSRAPVPFFYPEREVMALMEIQDEKPRRPILVVSADRMPLGMNIEVETAPIAVLSVTGLDQALGVMNSGFRPDVVLICGATAYHAASEWFVTQEPHEPARGRWRGRLVTSSRRGVALRRLASRCFDCPSRETEAVMPIVVVEAGPWWAFVVRGVFGILFGLLTFVLPAIALLTLVVLFGAWAIVDGIFNVTAAMQPSPTGRQPWWVLLLAGAIGILAGLLAFFVPGLTALSLLYLIAAWMIVRGFLEIIAAVRLRKMIEREWLFIVGGALSIMVGLALMAFPGAGALAVVLWIGAYALVFGALLVGVGLKVRWSQRSGRRPAGGVQELAPAGSH